jgi:hypothetical protein
MSALTLNGKNINLSLAYDGLTIYLNFATPNLFGALGLCRRSLLLNQELGLCSDEIEKTVKGSDFDRYIHHEDDDHSFYHQDNYPIEKDHMHFKFKAPMTRKKLEIVIAELEKHHLISSEESSAILSAYDERNKKALLDLRGSLSGTRDAEVDARAIIHYIRDCKDNDIIDFIHGALLEPRFDYLRTVTAVSMTTLWQGTDKEGKLVETSKQWAMIQKAVSLQLANNVRVECGNFSPKVATERATQLLASHSFFGLKRKAPMCTDKASSMFTAFKDKQDAVFNAKYQKHFGKFA